MNPTITKNDIELYKRFQKSPLFFIEKMWKLVPELDKSKFIKGRHITFHQYEVIRAVERALRGEAPRKISVAAGHGVGKSAVMSWLIIWYLFCYKDAQVACTAPTSEQMHDILWKELALWLGRMPKQIAELFDHTTGYLRVKERPDTWFARAKTARKESPEALAGVHGEFVFIPVDEASGVPDEIFRTAEGSMTGPNVLVLLISNPTRLLGYFFDTHHNDKQSWQRFNFSSEDSPIVEKDYIERMIAKHGKDSDEYNIRVKGVFPKEDAIDDKGYVPLLTEADLKYTRNSDFIGLPRMGIDPAGEGSNYTIWVVRDNFKAMIVAREEVSTHKSIAQKTLTLMDYHGVDMGRVWSDNFGVGANVALELAKAKKMVNEEERAIIINSVNVGLKSDDEMFLNKRAEAYWKMREWLKQGGELIGDKDKWGQLLQIRYRRELSNKMKIMGKEEMRKLGIESPDIADALMLTFYEGEYQTKAYNQPDYEPTTDYGV